MKIHPVLRDHSSRDSSRGRASCLILGLCLVACTSTDSLFKELPADGVADERSVEPLPLQPEAPIVPPAGATIDGEESPDEIGAGDLPLVGNIPLPVGPADPAPPAVPSACDMQPCEAELPPSDAAPVIVAVTPADGASGVTNDANIIIRFSQAMDRDATEAAYQSESVPSGSVSFLWSEDDTELTIVPDAVLEYDVGSDPELVEARRVSYFISGSAADAEGRRLSQPYEFSFSLLRQVSLTLFAVQDRDLSGSFRSNDTYGGAQCARAAINMCVGDSRVANQSEQYKGFISFELGELPETVEALSAILSLEITGTSGNPFASLGGLILEHTSFDFIGAAAFDADPLEELGLLAEQGAVGTIVRAQVGDTFIADSAERSMTQFRLRFEETTDDDTTSDVILSAWDTQTLDVTYLLP